MRSDGRPTPKTDSIPSTLRVSSHWPQGIGVGLCVIGLLLTPHLTMGLTHADFQTLNAYQEQAEQAMGQGDPNGAALTIGKAALLASQIGRKTDSGQSGTIEQVLTSFYRTQEHAYRAIALFQQGGSQAPASSGVCQTLKLSLTQFTQTTVLFNSLPSAAWPATTLPQQLKEWEEMLQEITKEFGCGADRKKSR